MIAEFPAGLILIVAGFLLPVLPPVLRGALGVAAPLAVLAQLAWLEPGVRLELEAFGTTLVLVRVDALSLVFGYVFAIAAVLNGVYSWHQRRGIEQPAALVYAGSAMAALFAGDLLALFIFWEISAIASALVIWSGGTPRAYRAGMRYLVVQLASGMLLAAGAALRWAESGSRAFDQIGLGVSGGALILAAFGVKCAFPLLHNWLQDAYPEASATGTVVLSAFTTKIGIYALARGFPGTELLVYIGTAMAVFPIFYAVIENDLRRVLAYSLNNQLGFMVVGIGLGTDLGLNGAVAHAFADILFKGLLFMSMGAVLLRAGSVKGTDLGGLYKSMPLTTAFCIVGAASISAFPLFSGFVTKSMIMTSAAQEGHAVVWLLLLFASAGVFHHAGIKIPFFAFFAHDSGIRCKEAPAHMLVAMGIAAALCIGIGIHPDALYALLPWPVDYAPYTVSHVLAQLQLLVFSALAFAWLMRKGIYPPELHSVNLDADWIVRRPGMRLVEAAGAALAWVWARVSGSAARHARSGALLLDGLLGPRAALTRTWPVGSMGLGVMAMLLALLLTYYVY